MPAAEIRKGVMRLLIELGYAPLATLVGAPTRSGQFRKLIKFINLQKLTNIIDKIQIIDLSQ